MDLKLVPAAATDSTSFEGGNKSGRRINRSCLVSIRLPARYQGLRPAFARSLCNGLESGDGRIQPIGALKRKHPPWILRGKSADLIQLPKLVLGECEFDRREIVLKLVEAFRANDDRGYHGLC